MIVLGPGLLDKARTISKAKSCDRPAQHWPSHAECPSNSTHGFEKILSYQISATTLPKGSMYPIIRYLVLGNNNYSIGFGKGYDYWVLGPLGLECKMAEIPSCVFRLCSF